MMTSVAAVRRKSYLLKISLYGSLLIRITYALDFSTRSFSVAVSVLTARRFHDKEVLN